MASLKILLFIIIGLLPNFSFIESYESKLRSELIPKDQELTYEVKNQPTRNQLADNVAVGADAALFTDVDSGAVLYQKNKDKKVQIASLTKMMTAVIIASENKPEEIVTVKTVSPHYLDALMGLSVGDKVKVSELLHGLLLNSGSDAAQTLALNNAKTEAAFVKKMNDNAQILGLTETHFSNVVGYDDSANYSTAQDLTKLAKIFLKSETLAKIVAKKSYVAKSESGKKYYLVNTNDLVGPSFVGLKTGTTVAAGQCLVTLYKEGDKQILGVILKSPSRFKETENIVRWTRTHFSW